MSASRCMHNARRILELPEADWPRQIDALPTTCPHTDCGEPKNCQQRIREYMRMQWRICKAYERMKARRAARGRT